MAWVEWKYQNVTGPVVAAHHTHSYKRCFLEILSSHCKELAARGLPSKFQQPPLSPQATFSHCSSCQISGGCLHLDTVAWVALTEWLREWGRYQHPNSSSPSLVTFPNKIFFNEDWLQLFLEPIIFLHFLRRTQTLFCGIFYVFAKCDQYHVVEVWQTLNSHVEQVQK